jgi:CBS domain containing-hemolysin-like protein
VGLATLARLIVGALIARYCSQSLQNTLNAWDEWITTLLMTPVVLIFGEVLPKALGRVHANKITLHAARPLHFFSILLAPLVWALTRAGHIITGKAPESSVSRVTRDDVKILAEIMAEQGMVGKESGEMLQNAMDLDQQPVETVMVPLIAMESLPDTATIGELMDTTARTGFTRLPVYARRVDRIIGVVSLKGIMKKVGDTFNEEELRQQSIGPYITRNLHYVPENQTVRTLLDELRKRSQPIAFVVDEYGGMSGMVSIEDLLEEIVGRLNDDKTISHEKDNFKRLSPTVFTCSGRMEIRLLEEYLGMEINNIGFETAAGLVLKLAGRIPDAGDKFTWRNLTITVLEVVESRIVKLEFAKNNKKENP